MPYECKHSFDSVVTMTGMRYMSNECPVDGHNAQVCCSRYTIIGVMHASCLCNGHRYYLGGSRYATVLRRGQILYNNISYLLDIKTLRHFLRIFFLVISKP